MRTIKEFFTGSPEEQRANETIAQLGQRENLRSRDQRRLDAATQLSRRLFMRQVLSLVAGIGVVAGGVSLFDRGTGAKLPENPPVTDPLYKDVIKYRTSNLPEELFQRVMADLLSQKQFPSLGSTAELLVENHQNPNNMSKYSGILPTVHPIPVGFAELGNPTAIFNGQGGTRSSAEPMVLKRKDSPETVSFTGVVVDPKETKSAILLNTHLINLNLSPWAMRILIAKEGSHPFYFSAVQTQMEDELNNYYDVPQDPNSKNILMATAMFSQSPAVKLPNVSPNFTKVPNFVDYAGFGHIVLDAVSMREQGLLTPLDQLVLRYNLQGGDDAINEGIIVRDSVDATKFNWSNSSPVSPSWYKVMEDVHKRLDGK